MPKYESLTFNGIRKEWLYIERGRSKPPFAARKRNLLTMPGYHGARLESTEIDSLVIHQPIGFRIIDDDDALAKKDELAAWLLTDEPVPLEFDDEPGRIYYAVVENTIDDFEKISVLRSGTITFVCPDPYAFGEEIVEGLTGQGTIIDVQGTAEAQPVFELEVLAPITFAMVSNGREFMLIGQPTDVTTTPVNKEEKIFHHDMEAMLGWVDTDVIGEGYIKGSFGVTNYGFYPVFLDPNAGAYEWYGPAKKHSLSEPVQDFLADMGFRFYAESRGGSVGRIEMYGLDDLNNIVFRAWIEDKWYGYDHFGICLEIGNGERTEYLTLPKNLEDIYGRMKVKREGNNWTLIMQQLQDGSGRVVVREWTRTLESDQVLQEVSQIQLAFQKFYDTNEEDMEVLLMRCFKLNDVEGIPYIAQAGDMITFDHRDNQNYDPEIRINGELRNDLKDFGATPFTLESGQNTLALLPDGAIEGYVRYRPTYK
ncbi:hypothetical protein Pryu01_01224 [Paraliobacillus ryukyuensis]|uniref:Putative phage tail component-like protein n=1 Tax=Paraliobacillus ryukyuensis TaxID=200904 RepID=A0A366EB49_9BACI|nr:distal tail protein Dit [Paraliobacillus ryukyuensis]RBO99542.1 putative phage tail component-like protein [Paraliobacillus ryukyuensis]